MRHIHVYGDIIITLSFVVNHTSYYIIPLGWVPVEQSQESHIPIHITVT